MQAYRLRLKRIEQRLQKSVLMIDAGVAGMVTIFSKVTGTDMTFVAAIACFPLACGPDHI